MINEQKRVRRWLLQSDDAMPDREAAVAAMAEELSLQTVTAELLYNRGYRTVEDARRFIRLEDIRLESPFLLRDMDAAIARIRQAVETGEKITIFGDYDVDGVTAVCVLYLYLSGRGATIDYYIPNREGEGYGMSHTAIDTLAQRGTRLIVTVDTGITANEEIAYATSLGIDVVVTDHHECRPELPVATAVVNPHRPDCPYPFKEMAGVGVIFRCMCAYEETVTGSDRLTCIRTMCEKYADLVAIGTIADVMPLTGENRFIVSYGLGRIRQSDRIGVRALVEAASARADGTVVPFETASQKITSSYIGFTLAPRINAAGRVRTASLAVELFLADSYDRAYEAATQLCAANRERQEEENKIIREAYEKIEHEHDFAHDSVIVLDADTWHHGVIGIVSSRITEKYGLPCILVSFKGNTGEIPDGTDLGKGSGRSIKGINLVDALAHCDDRLVKYGGHELAAGLSITRAELPAFRREINEYVRTVLQTEPPDPVLYADCALTFPQMRLPLVRELHVLEPFGTGNPTPVFVVQDACVYEVTGLKSHKHTRLTVGDDNNRLCAMYFSHTPEEIGITVGDRVSLLFQLDENEWNGRSTVQLIIRDIHLSESATDIADAARESETAQFEAVWSGGTFDSSTQLLPCREDFVTVYRYIDGAVREGRQTLSHTEILTGLLPGTRTRIGYAKLKIIIRVFQEMNLLGIDEPEPEVYTFRIRYTQNRVDLEKSTILRRLRTQQR